MSWLHPWALGLGALAVGMPLAVHLLTRPRPVRLPLSTVRFVLEAIRQRRTRYRLRDVLVLALRTLAVLLLAWAVARPQVGEEPLISSSGTGRTLRIVVVDTSQSMAAGVRGVHVFERARSLAAKHLTPRGGLEANLILAGAKAAAVLERPSQNLAALREELAAAGPRPERLNVQAALSAASEMLAQAAGEQVRQELVVVSDFQRSNWVTADFSVLPEGTLIQLESVAPKQVPPNLGILSIRSQGRAEPGSNVRMEVEVGNYTPAARRVRVELLVADAPYHLEGLCPAGTGTVLSTEVQPHTVGWQPVTARLVDVEDALPEDDTRPFILQVHPTPRYVLVTRQPATGIASSSYFMAAALTPLPRGQQGQGTQVKRFDPLALSREGVADSALIVLDHPGKLAPEAIALVASLMTRGRSVFYVASEPADATNLKLLAEAGGTALRMPVEFTPADTGRRRDLFLAEVRSNDPPWNVFGDELPAATGPLRFSGGLGSRRIEGGLEDDVLATYSDRSVCLMVTACGAGWLAVLNAELGDSNLPASPVFVPLVGELVEQLLEQRGGEQPMQCGEPFAVYLPPEAQSVEGLQIVGPAAGTAEVGELVEESLGVFWRAGAAGAPGVYSVKRDNETIYAAAATLAPQESDLRPLEGSILNQRLAGGHQVYYRSATGSEGRVDDLWTWFAAACVLCMLVEVTALKGFRT